MLDDALRHVCHGRAVDVRLDFDRGGEGARRNLAQIGLGLVRLREVAVFMDLARGIPLEDVDQRDGRAERPGDARGGRQRGLRQVGTIQWDENVFEHGLIHRRRFDKAGTG